MLKKTLKQDFDILKKERIPKLALKYKDSIDLDIAIDIKLMFIALEYNLSFKEVKEQYNSFIKALINVNKR